MGRRKRAASIRFGGVYDSSPSEDGVRISQGKEGAGRAGSLVASILY